MSSKPKNTGGPLVITFSFVLIGMLAFGFTGLAKTAKDSYAKNQSEITRLQDAQKLELQSRSEKAKAAIAQKAELKAQAASPVAGANVEIGKAKYMLCATCHGPNGEGMTALKSPALAGQSAEYIIRQLQYFKHGVRGADPAKDMQGSMMAPMAKMLSDDDMTNVAAYIGTLTGKAQHTLTGDANAGKAKYMLCATCHGPNGEGMPAMKSPGLTNLPDYYIVSQLQNFKHGVRGADPAKDMQGSMMAPMAKMLSEEDMKNLAAYIKTLAK
ncbi:c-type cytochrome [Lentisphaera profundi]|uniref:C-type cytochrome n=1 Tax=Lentisphaera profundi TaxID=1658616 RepID=A0ABY7VPP3_9BACT|nr:c-type cytochrome [Lentisphaera profundi]WDE95689.1 c-type cytochrome [Lentisphaera profundi]